jgi:alkanesulfonate monooxygenase SsuD/methylene tetrahydromethanopterin reductase-like flavin-dependent oxidoreductase (luciferase family)
MRIGIAVLPSSPWSEMTERARTVEAAGFDTLMTGDHLRHPFDPEHEFLDGWSVLAAWGAVTSRVRLAMLVSNVIYRNPAVLAKQAVAVDHISNGRLDLGIGSGVFETDHDMAGVPRWSLDERLGRTEEVVVIVDRLLRGVVDDFEGRWYSVRQAAMSPLGVQEPRPPIVIGANHAAMLRLAAERADVWNTWGGYGHDSDAFLELTRDRVRFVDRACEELDRDPASLERSVLVHHSAFDPWHSTDAFRTIVDRFGELGFGECIMYWPRPEERDTFDRVATDVLPQLSRTPA